MKNFSFVVLIAMALTLVACGNKNSSGGSGGSLSMDKFSTGSYWVNESTGAIEYGSAVYQPADQPSIMILSNAIELAKRNGLRSTMINGAYKWKFRMTAKIYNPYSNGYGQQYPQQPQYPNQGTSNLLQVQSAEVVR